MAVDTNGNYRLAIDAAVCPSPCNVQGQLGLGFMSSHRHRAAPFALPTLGEEHVKKTLRVASQRRKKSLQTPNSIRLGSYRCFGVIWVSLAPAQHQFAALIQKFDGTVFVKERVLNGDTIVEEIRFYKSGRYNLLKCDIREKIKYKPSLNSLYLKEDWTSKEDQYVAPTNGRDEGRWKFVWQPNSGQEFVLGCIGGRVSADGRTIEEINPGSREEEVLGVWHRQ